MTRDEFISSLATVNEFAISTKLRRLMNSQHGKKLVQKASGVIQANHHAQMDNVVDTFIDMLTTYAGMFDLPFSVMKHFKSLTSEPFEFDPTLMSFSTVVYFEDKRTGAMRRESLLVEGGEAYDLRTGDGIDDIVYLFNDGYSARSRVWGLWHGEHTGSCVWRPPLHFIDKTVQWFNEVFRAYGISAIFWYPTDWT